MSHLTLVAPSSPSMLRPALAHDIRNAMAVIALNVEMLEILAGPSGAKAASAAHQLLTRVSALCNDSLREKANAFSAPRRTSFDIVDTVRQVIDTLGPIMPAGLKIKLHPDYRHMVLGNPNDAFRIIFNLAHNVVTLARLSGEITLLDFHLETLKAVTLLRVTDNGPGISAEARAQLFRSASAPTSSAAHGHGLLIARELAERNGGTLQLVEAAPGTQFVLSLSSLAAVDSTSRLLGKRTAS